MTSDDGGEKRAENYLRTLHNLKARQIEIDCAVRALIKAARLEGVTWRELGVMMGTSGQAAWEKYRPHDLQDVLPGQDVLPVEIER